MATSEDVTSQSEAVQVQNIKALSELTTQLVAGFNNITIQASQSYAAVMSQANASLLFNLDLANKRAIKWLEYDVQEAAAETPMAQVATKAAQSTPPETGLPTSGTKT